MNLSVLIPARNEPFLARTIADVLAHSSEATEVIAVLDGAWAETPIPDHPRVTLLRQGASIGQRAATNQAARLARGRYVMKLDAHCSMAPDFDEALVTVGDELGPDVTQIPRMRNLHAFDWVCDGCQARTYQGPKPAACPCGGTAFTMDVVWFAKPSPITDCPRFDNTLHFQYWNSVRNERGRILVPAYHRRPEAQGEIVDSMTSIGACFVMRRERYWEIGGLDEGHGSWGQMGTEIACKSWLSGGRHVTNRRTWFSHMFRTQEGWKHPYPLSHSAVEFARAHSRKLWIDQQWPQAVRPLRWILDKFWPVPGWTEEDRASLPTSVNSAPTPVQTAPAKAEKGLVYYTDNRGDRDIRQAMREQLRRVADRMPIVSVEIGTSDVPAFADRTITLSLERGALTMFRQILTGLEALDTEYAFLVEHDVLYPAEAFAFTPPRRDRYYYNVNTWKVDAETGRAVTYETQQTSGLCADRQLLIAHYRARIARVEREGFSRRMGFEPGTHRRAERVDDVPAESWRSSVPMVDIRHGHNLTPSRWRQEDFRDPRNCQGWQEADEIPGWGRTRGQFREFLREVSRELVACAE